MILNYILLSNLSHLFMCMICLWFMNAKIIVSLSWKNILDFTFVVLHMYYQVVFHNSSNWQGIILCRNFFINLVGSWSELMEQAITVVIHLFTTLFPFDLFIMSLCQRGNFRQIHPPHLIFRPLTLLRPRISEIVLYYGVGLFF